MDRRSIAYLDKTRLKVMCGSCGKQIAQVHEHRFVIGDDFRWVVGGKDRARRFRFTGSGSAWLPLSYKGQDSGYALKVSGDTELEAGVQDGVGYLNGILRHLAIDYGFRLQPDGVWKLNARSEARVKKGKYPSVRRQRKVDSFFDGGATYCPKPGTEGSRPEHVDLKLPARVQCMWCSSVQYLEVEPLQLSESEFLMGPDLMRLAKERWPAEDFKRFYGDTEQRREVVTWLLPDGDTPDGDTNEK